VASGAVASVQGLASLRCRRTSPLVAETIATPERAHDAKAIANALCTFRTGRLLAPSTEHHADASGYPQNGAADATKRTLATMLR
jgi:hypothetical protein